MCTRPKVAKFNISSSILLVFLLVSASKHAWPQIPDFKSAASQRFENKMFLIKGWYQDANLKYEPSGNVMGNPQVGSWTTSGVQIHSVAIHKDEITLRGSRIVWQYDKGKRKLMPVRFSSADDVTIIIQQQPAQLAVSDLERLQNAIFVGNFANGDFPDYWRNFLFHGEKDPLADRNNPALPETFEGLASNGHPVYRIKPGRVNPPRILKHKEPEYLELARRARIQGTTLLSAVVDEQGEVTQIQILRPIGVGLDDQAVKNVSQWRFEPAMRDGKPVAVQIDVEVKFELR